MADPGTMDALVEETKRILARIEEQEAKLDAMHRQRAVMIEQHKNELAEFEKRRIDRERATPIEGKRLMDKDTKKKGHPMRFVFVNKSTVCTDAQVEKMAAAIDTQFREDVGPMWGVTPVSVVFVPKAQTSTITDSDLVLSVIDDNPQVPGAGGFHDEDPNTGKPYGEILAAVYLRNGGTIEDVEEAASHEAIEALLDMNINLWCDCGDGSEQIREGCDRVESDVYSKGDCKVSNFLLPAAFDPLARPGTKRDFLGTLPTDASAKPLDMTKGGYVTFRKVGTDHQKFAKTLAHHEEAGRTVVYDSATGITRAFGPAMPAWKREMKLKHSRVHRREAKMHARDEERGPDTKPEEK